MKRKILALFLVLAMLPLSFGSMGVMAQGNGQISVVSATADTAFPGYGAENMIDGNANEPSRWCANGTNSVLEFAFDGAQKVNKIIINEYQNPNPGNAVEGFTVNAWNGAGWDLVTTGSTIGDEKAIDFNAVETEKIQLVLTCPGWASFYEVSFYGTSVAGIAADAADSTLYCGGKAGDAALDKTKIMVSQIDTAGGKTPVENVVFTFSGYDENVVSVDDDGTVHAVGAGETKITVSTEISGQPFSTEAGIAVSNQTVERVAVGAAKNNVKVQERLPLLVYAFLDDGTKLDVTQRLAPVFETSDPDARIYNGALTLDAFTQQKNITVTAASSNGSIESTDFLAVQTQNVALSAAGALAEGTNTLAGTQDACVNDGNRPAQSGTWNDAGVAPGDVGYMTITFPEEKTIDLVNVFTYGDDPAAEPTFASTAVTFGNEDFHLEYWNGIEFAPIDGASVTGNTFAWTSFSFAPVTTEKIRVAITKTRNANSRISEIEAFEAYVPPALEEEVQVPAASAWASSTFAALPGYEADKMIDGQLGENSRWCANEVGAPQTLEFTFDGAQKINKIVINEHEQAGNYTTNFAVNVWNGADWVNAASGFAIGASKEIALVTQNTEKVQIKLEGVGYRSICEVSFYFNPAYDEISSITAQAEETTLYLGGEAAALGLNKTAITAFQTAASGAVLALAPESLSFGGFDDTVISVDAGGVVTALGAGSTSVAVSAQINGKTYVSNVAVTVSAVTVDDIAVSAVKSTVREGERLPLGVSARFSDGSTKDVTQILSPVFSVTGGSASVVNGCLVLSSYLAGDEITVAAASDAGTAISPLTLKPTRSENVALAASGAAASASSELTPVASVIDGDRAGRGGAVWNDNGGASDEAPSWCQVTFAEEKTIDTIFVFTLQDDNNNPAEPTIDMGATAWGVENYFVQYEDGGQWKDVPGAKVTGNTLVWQSFSFAPITTGAIRVVVTKARMTNARITEVEAYEAEDEPQGKTQVPVKSAACDPASFPGYGPELMIDGNTSTRWSANNDQVQTLEFTFAEAANVNQMQVQEFQEGINFIKSYTLNAWVDGQWVTVSQGTSLGTQEISFLTRHTDKMQLVVSGSGLISIYEVGFSYDPAAGSISGIQASVQDGTLYLGEKAAAAKLGATAITANQLVAGSNPEAIAPRLLTFSGFDESIISVDENGVVTAKGAGSTTVTVSFEAGGISYTDTVSVTVSPLTVESFKVFALKNKIYNGERLPLSVVAVLSDKSVLDVHDKILPVFTTQTQEAKIENRRVWLSPFAEGAKATIQATAEGLEITPLALTGETGQKVLAVSAEASSTYGDYKSDFVIDGDRTGASGSWNDNGTASEANPSWCQMNFGEAKTIGTVFVFTVQDNFSAPQTPTTDMKTTQYGLEDFSLQYFDGSQWQDVPGAVITGNGYVWQSFTFEPVTTDKIRVVITKTRQIYSRITEIEAYEPPAAIEGEQEMIEALLGASSQEIGGLLDQYKDQLMLTFEADPYYQAMKAQNALDSFYTLLSEAVFSDAGELSFAITDCLALSAVKTGAAFTVDAGLSSWNAYYAQGFDLTVYEKLSSLEKGSADALLKANMTALEGGAALFYDCVLLGVFATVGVQKQSLDLVLRAYGGQLGLGGTYLAWEAGSKRQTLALEKIVAAIRTSQGSFDTTEKIKLALDEIMNQVIAEAPDERGIVTFGFAGYAGAPVAIAGTDITVTLPYGADVSALVAEFTTGENVSRVAVNQKTQESGKATNDFSSPVKYYVTMSTGATRIYTVTVNFTPNPVSLYEDFESYNPGDFPEKNFSIFDSKEGLAVEKDDENQVFALTSGQAPVTRMVFTKDLKQQLLGGVKQLSLRLKANNVFSGAFYLSTSANNAGNIVHIWAVRCDIKNNQYTISVGKGSNINDVTLVGSLTCDGYITLNLLVDAQQKRYQLSAADESGEQIASGWQAWDSSAFDLNALSQTMFHMNATINQNASVFVDDVSLIDFGQKAVLQSQKVLYDAPVLVRLLGEVQGKDPENIKLRTSSGSAVEATNTFDAASGVLTIQPAAPLSYPASYVVDFSSYDSAMAPLAVSAIGYVQLSAVMDYDSGKIVVTGQTMSPNMALTVNGIDLTSDAAGAFQTAFVPQGVSSGDAVTVTATVMAGGEEKSCSCQVTYLSPQGASGVIAQIKTASANELAPLLAQLGIDILSDPFYALLADKAAFAAMLQSQSFATVDELRQAAYTSIAMCVVEEGTVFADASFFADALGQLNAGKYKLGFGLEKSGFTKLSASQQQKVLASLSKNGLTKLGELQNLFVTTTALRTINDGKTFDEKYDAVTSFLNNYPELLGISNTYAKWGLDTVRQISVRKQMANNALKKTYDLKTFQSDLDQAIEDADDNVKPKPSQTPSGGKGPGSSGGPSKIDVPAPTQPGEAQETFIDLDGYDWAKESIYSLAGAGILNGYGDGTFRPGESVTRAQFVKMLVMACGLYDASAQVGAFTDISEGDWYYPYIAAAYQAGIVKGVSETEFGPDALLTREQMAVMLYRAAQTVGINISGTAQAQSFTDSDEISDYAKIPVTKLSQSGIINGMGDGRFAPKETANRAMAAKVMHGMFSLRK